MLYAQFLLVEGTGNWSDGIGKNSTIFPKTEYCFHAPAVSGIFPSESARTFHLDVY
jgi:hypothetical protein